MPEVGYVGRVAVGTAAAALAGLVMMRLMDEEHDYEAGTVPGAFRSRQERFPDGNKEIAHMVSANHFYNKDGLAVYFRAWMPMPVAQPCQKALVVISHGMGEHSGRYEALAKALVAKGFVVYALDHQGHGRSEGTRMHYKWFPDIIADVHHVTEIAKSRHPLLEKCFLLGHSFGSLVAVHAVHAAPRLYDGVVLSAPPLKVVLPPGQAPALAFLGTFLPKLPMPGLDVSTLTRNIGHVDHYHNDPLNKQGPNTARFLAELIKAADKVPSIAPTFPIPYLLMHGTGDGMCRYDGSKEFHEATKVEDKTFVTFEGAFHELFNEPDAAEKAIPETVSWLEARL